MYNNNNNTDGSLIVYILSLIWLRCASQTIRDTKYAYAIPLLPQTF